MVLTVIRRNVEREPSPTRGILFVDGRYFGSTIEPGKTNGKGPIPKGIYRVILNRSMKFGRVLPLVLDVPGFEGIRFHAGLREENTRGCICVGSRRDEEILMELLGDEWKKSKNKPFVLNINDWDDDDVSGFVSEYESLFECHGR